MGTFFPVGPGCTQGRGSFSTCARLGLTNDEIRRVLDTPRSTLFVSGDSSDFGAVPYLFRLICAMSEFLQKGKFMNTEPAVAFGVPALPLSEKPSTS